ncbi:SH3 domain-containing protein [Rhizobium cremeum]|uniref:SH3 domain-containing protein n=1 Tax=Rhizobium cremeum TaxID=2813827 RepID=UPI000DE4EE3E
MRRAMSLFFATVLLTVAAALLPQTLSAEEPRVIPAPNLYSNPSDDASYWHVMGLRPGDTLNVRSGPGPAFRIIGVLEEGTPIRNLGCREREGGYWCRIATYDRPRLSGWVNGRYVSDEDEYVEPDGAYRPYPADPSWPGANGYERTGAFNCRFGRDPRLFRCLFGLQRRGTSAEIAIETPDGVVRSLIYRAGRFTSEDGAEVRSRKEGANAVVTIEGVETYFIPDNVVMNW